MSRHHRWFLSPVQWWEGSGEWGLRFAGLPRSCLSTKSQMIFKSEERKRPQRQVRRLRIAIPFIIGTKSLGEFGKHIFSQCSQKANKRYVGVLVFVFQHSSPRPSLVPHSMDSLTHHSHHQCGRVTLVSPVPVSHLPGHMDLHAIWSKPSPPLEFLCL